VHFLTADYVLVDAPADQTTAVLGGHLGEDRVSKDSTAFGTTIAPRYILRNPSLDAIAEVPEIDDLTADSTDLKELPAITG
jgi:hypothetical protein